MDEQNKHDRYWYVKETKPSLYMWIFTQMALGASYAALAFFGVIAFILILVVVSKILPEDPFAAIEAARGLTALV